METVSDTCSNFCFRDDWISRTKIGNAARGAPIFLPLTMIFPFSSYDIDVVDSILPKAKKSTFDDTRKV